MFRHHDPAGFAGRLLCLALFAAAPGTTSVARAAEAAAGPAQGASASAAITLPECEPRGGLPNFFAKLEAGGPVRIAYLGGSITEADGWRMLSRRWFADQYPRAKVEEIRATISGTGAEFGACRLQNHVLRHSPDLVFIEFAVNGAGATTRRAIRSIEGIIRQIRRHDPATEACLVFTVSTGMTRELKENRSPQVVMNMKTVADHYGVPTIDFGPSVARLLLDGKLVMKGAAPAKDAPPDGTVIFSADGTHPLDAGHRLYLDAIARSVPSLKAAGRPGPHMLPAPLDADNWEDASMVAIDAPGVGRSAGWKKIEPPDGTEKRQRISQYFDGVWAASTPGETLEFAFDGVGFGLSGFRDPATGQFRVAVDDLPPINGTFFDSYSYAGRVSHKAWLYPDDLPRGRHRVKIEFIPGQPAREEERKKAGAKVAAARTPPDTVLQLAAILVAGAIIR